MLSSTDTRIILLRDLSGKLTRSKIWRGGDVVVGFALTDVCGDDAAVDDADEGDAIVATYDVDGDGDEVAGGAAAIDAMLVFEIARITDGLLGETFALAEIDVKDCIDVARLAVLRFEVMVFSNDY